MYLRQKAPFPKLIGCPPARRNFVFGQIHFNLINAYTISLTRNA